MKHKVRALAGVVAITTASLANAELYVLDENLTLDIGVQLAYGLRYRLESPDPDLIGVQNPAGIGQNPDLPSGDNGTLNYPRHSFTDNQVAIAFDGLVNWNNRLSFFLSGYGFYDFENSDGDRAYIDLGDHAKDQVAHDADFRQAYLKYSFELADRPMQVRVGAQNLRWSHSTFYAATGLGQIDAFDLPALSRPTSRLGDALKPIEMVWAQADLSPMFGVEVFYQYGRAETDLLANGIYMGTDDALSPDREFMPVGPFSPDRQGACAGNQASGYPVAPAGCYGSTDPNWWSLRTAEAQRRIVETHILEDGSEIAIPLDADGEVIPFDPATGELLDANRRIVEYKRTGETASFRQQHPDAGGQYGLRLRGLIPNWNNTLWALSYARIHSRLPRIYVVPGQQALINSTLVSTRNPAYGQLEILDRINIQAQDSWLPWFYPEDIDIFGFSLNTSVPLTGTAVSAEVTYIPENPLAVSPFEIAHFVIPNKFAKENGLEHRETPLSEELDTVHATLSLVQVLGPALGSTNMTVGLEAAYMHIYDIPTLDGLAGNDPDHRGVMLAPMGQGFGEGYTPTAPTATGWGYTLFAGAVYNGVFDNVTMRPTFRLRHDVEGYSPSLGGGPFLEKRKVFDLGLAFNLLSKYDLELTYRAFTGGVRSRKFNQVNDRDFLQVVLRYDF